MSERSQRKEESTTAYFYEKVKLCCDINLVFEDVKEQVLIGLWSRDLCSSLASKKHSDIDDLVHDLINLGRISSQRTERIRNTKETNVTKKQSSSSTPVKPLKVKPKQGLENRNPDRRPLLKSDTGELKCYNCSKFGHISRDCPDPRRELYCVKCKGKGHTQRHCAVIDPNRKPEVHYFNTNRDSSIARF
ncbi:uncharacterized protein LOC122502409 [Leptopilina heterotoma]|uniref:uncharacterized protein LOC122502409 n=1 Tax=Leptopilina heterotoma TaxID=63436 RepID=UPI001CA95B3E|nr:uncharacterized protein LOC122502409 [Leptopilina heterotoma]